MRDQELAFLNLVTYINQWFIIIVKHAYSLTKKGYQYSASEIMYDEIEKLGIMIQSEPGQWDETIMLIWGYKFPTDRDEADKVIHHALLVVDHLSKQNFRIVYFHSNMQGSGYRIPKMIKSICKNMSKIMRTNMRSFDILHANFSLKLSLFFFDKISLTNYKIRYVRNLQNLYEHIDSDQQIYIKSKLPQCIEDYDVGLYDKDDEEVAKSGLGDNFVKRSFK